MAKITWTDWQSIDVASDRWEPAIYQMRLISRGKPRPMQRLLGTDPLGILTIGQTKSMESRRNNFLSGMYKCYGHSAGNLLYYLLKHTNLTDAVPEQAVQYRFAAMGSEKDAKLWEGRHVKDYIIRYGEPPPLNSSIPDRYGDWCKLD